MSFFNDDPFEDIVREFFSGSSPRRREQFIRGEEEDRIIDFVEDNGKVCLIFELPGYEEKDVSIQVDKAKITISANKANSENIKEYLNSRLSQGISISKKLPSFVDPKNYSLTMKNGVLEIVFNKSSGGKNEPRSIPVH